MPLHENKNVSLISTLQCFDIISWSTRKAC